MRISKHESIDSRNNRSLVESVEDDDPKPPKVIKNTTHQPTVWYEFESSKFKKEREENKLADKTKATSKFE